MAQHIGAELQFETVAGFKPFRRRHDAGIIDQAVQRLALFQHAIGKATHRSE